MNIGKTQMMQDLQRYLAIFPKAPMTSFAQNITTFNAMYKMPIAPAPRLISAKRLIDFKSILGKELNEIDDILAKWESKSLSPEGQLELLTDIADLLGDLQVYCASEMAKWGLPLEATLQIIMESNFSKMGADGLPIYDDQDKLQKGPHYWKPEPRISDMLSGRIEAHRLLMKAPL
jgi:hypothetical protein